ncbi:unnamed protein product, partial [Choristocarpus tenellus]
MNPLLPSEVNVGLLPRQNAVWGWELFRFSKTQGVSVVRRLHSIAQIINAATWIFILIAVFVNEDAGLTIVALIGLPIVWIIYALLIRAVCELAVSVMLIPALLANQLHQGAREGMRPPVSGG